MAECEAMVLHMTWEGGFANILKRKSIVLHMTWEGGWDYSEALSVRSVWELDHTTPHTLHHINIYTAPHPKRSQTRTGQKNLANRFIGLKTIFQSGSLAAAWRHRC